jgi:DNA anti-recombination protein RmuC
MKRLNGTILLTIISVFLLSCGGGGGAGDRIRQQQLEEVRANVLTELNSLKHEVQHRIDYLDEETEKAGSELKQQLEEYRTRLDQQLTHLDEEMALVSGATIENWNNVVENASETAAEVTARTSEISRKVRELLE